MSNETIFIDFFQSVANLPGSKSNSKNIDPKSESSFARFFYNETIFNDFSANFPAKGLLAREAKALKVTLTEILVQPTAHPLGAPHFFQLFLAKGPLWKFVIFHCSFFELN